MAQEIILTTIDRRPPIGVPDNDDLMFISRETNGFQISYGTLRDNIRDSIAFNLFPPGQEGFGLIFESGRWRSRRLRYSDLDGIPIQSPFNRNISVTFTNTDTEVTVNPAPTTQEYIIRSETYQITTTSVLNIPALINSANERIDFVLLLEGGVVSYRQGIEATVAVSPEINGDELILTQLLVRNSGVTPSDPGGGGGGFVFDNGLTETGGSVVFGGTIDNTTSLQLDAPLTFDGTSLFRIDSPLRLPANIQDSSGNVAVGSQALVSNGTTSFTWRDTSSFGSTSALTDNGDGTYTHSDGVGTDFIIDTRAASNPIVDVGGFFTSTNVEGALQEAGAILEGQTANRVIISDSSGDITTNDAFTVDIANSRLGIGTTSPDRRLDVETTINGEIARFSNTSDANSYFGFTGGGSGDDVFNIGSEFTITKGTGTDIESTNQLQLIHPNNVNIRVTPTSSGSAEFALRSIGDGTVSVITAEGSADTGNAFLDIRNQTSATPLELTVRNGIFRVQGTGTGTATNFEITDSAGTSHLTFNDSGVLDLPVDGSSITLNDSMTIDSIDDSGVRAGRFRLFRDSSELTIQATSTGGFINRIDEYRSFVRVSNPTALADHSVLFSRDFNGAGTGSPFFITEDGEIINLRQSEIKPIVFEFFPDRITSAQIGFRGDDTVIETDSLEFDSTNVFNSITLSVMRNNAATRDFMTATGLSDLQDWIGGSNIIGGQAYTSPSSSDYWQLRLDAVFMATWNVHGYATLNYKLL